MPSTPRLLHTATVAPSVGVQFRTPTPSMREIVCENIRILCCTREVTRRDLATMLGISYNAVHPIWNHKRKVSAEELWSIAAIFEIPVERFYTLHDWNDSWSWTNPERNTNG
ncbi:helix-turn-helix transcriptional regulator [Leifsonia sp. Leaf336]|uniref:helix-turn-helix transcriptional regulator n=1 Tax=Leifsonia sp. Leaf336 TaxID=1736341 RepID=UPI001F2DACAF|nr:helix-turn-helix transcriptional regulator [Leifsonia sp. Leaf336]